MSAVIVPFPLARRRAFVVKQANSMAIREDGAAERYLVDALERQFTTLTRKGVSEATAAREVRALETAIRVELARMTAAPKGTAA